MADIVTSARSPQLGMICMAIAAILFPVKDSFLKAQDERVPILLAITAYFTVQLLVGVIALFATRNKARWFPFGQMTRTHVIRSLTLVISLALFFASLRYVPIAVAVTLFTIQSLFYLIFGKMLLDEPFRHKHIIFVILASIGVILIVRPHQASEFNPAILMPLVSAALFGLYIILTRKLGTAESAAQLLCQDGAVAVAVFSGLYSLQLLITGAHIPNIIWDLRLFVLPPLLAALIGTLSSLMMIQAARLAPAAKLAPISYLEVVSASLIGIFVFNERLDLTTTLGIAVIVGVCLVNSVTAQK